MRKYRALLLCSFFISGISFAKEFGTNLREEIEIKQAFIAKGQFSPREFLLKLKSEIKKLTPHQNEIKQSVSEIRDLVGMMSEKKLRNSETEYLQLEIIKNSKKISSLKKYEHKLEIEKILRDRAYVEEVNQHPIFIDYYFDDSKFSLYRNGYLYRLRRRFKKSLDYYLNDLFGLSEPIRVEIQSKWKKGSNDGVYLANESRFEFRKESYPFSLNEYDVPSLSNSFDFFKKIAESGRYHDKVIAPFSYISGFVQNKSLLAQAKFINHRTRFHINIPNPWGKGPNPAQAFIFSFDEVEVKCLTKECEEKIKNRKFYELEIEIDRSTLRDVGMILKDYEFSQKNHEKIIFSKTKQFYEALKKDQQLFYRLSQKLFLDEELEPLPMMSKYKRVFHD